MPLTGKDVWDAIVKAGFLSGPYDPRTNRSCANADVLARLLNDALSRRANWLPNLLQTEDAMREREATTPREFVLRLYKFLNQCGYYLDQTLFWNQGDWNGSSIATKFTTTDIAATLDWPASPQLSAVAFLSIQSQTLTHTAGENTATASLRPRPSPELYFAAHMVGSPATDHFFGHRALDTPLVKVRPMPPPETFHAFSLS